MSSRTLLGQIEANIVPGPHFEADVPGAPAPRHPKVRLVAFYLPQFHPIPENDAWWGPGFTEWTNVTKAVPRFAGHLQPRLPADLGFYDLRSSDALRAQAKLARRYGIAAFCFHHYWFNGRRILQTPLESLLADPTIDMPFCLNWANENWTRRWDGCDDDVLLAQHYSESDDLAFAAHLTSIVRDPRYLRVDGRPLLMIYRPGLLPDSLATMRRWRTQFARAGLPNPYIVMAQAFADVDPRLHGIDAAAEFPPHKVGISPPINHRLQFFDPDYSGHVLEYSEVAALAGALPRPQFKLFRGVSPSWDNEARKPGRGFTMTGSDPAKYGAWLSNACQAAVDEAAHPDERIVFINAWNEWAEGAYLEPDRHFGHAYLAETARVLNALHRPTKAAVCASDRPRIALVSHDAHFHGAQTLALALTREIVAAGAASIRVLIGGQGELAAQFEASAPTITVPGDFNDAAAWEAAASDLAAAGVTGVICNTLVSARAIRPLRTAGLRIVQMVHELPSLIRQYGLEDAARDAAAHAAAVVFASAYVRDRFVELAGPIRGQVVVRPQGLQKPPPPRSERLRARETTRRAYGIDEGRRVILGVGYGDMRKGLDLWSILIRRIAHTEPTAAFVWVGRVDPTIRHWLEHDLKETGTAESLILPGQVGDMSGWYSAADVFVSTSREDPFPSVVIEAMAFALPVVVFEGSGGAVELVDRSGGVSVPFLDASAMADAVLGLLRDPQGARLAGARLAERASSGFGFAEYAASLVALAAPSRPSVSVIVPNYNYARHLRERVESIWAQTVVPQELILLDDASSDGSAELLAELAEESPIPATVVVNPVNSGSVSRQWARGVTLARSDLVWIAEADDFADPGFLEALISAFADPDVILSYCESRMVDESGRVTSADYRGYVADIDPVRWSEDFLGGGAEEIGRALSVKNTIPNVSAVVFRREALASVLTDRLDELAERRNSGDWLCYIRLLQQGGKLSFTARALNNHRRHGRSLTIAAADRRHLREIAELQDLAACISTVTPETRETALRYREAVAAQFGIKLEPAL